LAVLHQPLGPATLILGHDDSEANDVLLEDEAGSSEQRGRLDEQGVFIVLEGG
jgi:hypothetical protein